jgi:hypothetical protein
MPIIYQKFITRADVRENKDKLYVFGDNLERRGYGGQAKEMRGEPNAIGIATKKSPSMDEDAFFDDEYFHQNVKHMTTDFERVLNNLKLGKVIVLPTDGIGTGLSMMEEKSPKTYNFLQKMLQLIKDQYNG